MHLIFRQNNFMFVIVFVCLFVFCFFFVWSHLYRVGAPSTENPGSAPETDESGDSPGIQVVYFHPIAYIFERSRYIWMYGWNYLNYVLSATTAINNSNNNGDKQQQKEMKSNKENKNVKGSFYQRRMFV